jgi:hypothetical protein
MRKTKIIRLNNLEISKEIYEKILKGIDLLVKYRNPYHFIKMGFKRIYPKIASGCYFFKSKKLGLFVKCSFTMDMPWKFPEEQRKKAIPSIILDFPYYETMISQWIIQPIADVSNQLEDYKNLIKSDIRKYYCDMCKWNVGNYKNKSVMIDW